MTLKRNWDIADRISDRIVDTIDSELKAMQETGKVEPLQLLAGQLLALCALERTIPMDHMPQELKLVYASIHLCLHTLVERV